MRARAALLATLAAAASACAPAKTPAAQMPKVGPAIDTATAESDAKGLAGEVYNTLGRGKTDNLIPLLAPSLVVFGPRRLDALASRSDALVALGKVIDARKQAAVKSSELTVVPAPSGRSAWAVDVVVVDGTPLAVTAVLSNSDDLWLVDAATIARTPAKATVKTELARDAVVPNGMAATPKPDERAQGAIAKFQAGLADQTRWGADLAEREHPVVIGPLAGEVARTKKDVKALWAKRAKAKVRELAVGDIAAAVTPDGELAWVSAPVTRASADDDGVVPLRVFAIYENTGGTWQLAALQESLAIDAPGMGVAYKKLAPAAPKADAPAPEVVATAKPTKPAKHAKAEPTREPDDEPAAKPAKAKVAKVAKVTKPAKAKPAKQPAPAAEVADTDDEHPVKPKRRHAAAEDAKPRAAAADEWQPHKKKKHKRPVEDDGDEVQVTDE